MVDDRVPAYSRHSNADDWVAATMVYDEAIVYRFARELYHRHIDCGSRVQLRNAYGCSYSTGCRHGPADSAHVQYYPRRVSTGEAWSGDGLRWTCHHVRTGDRPNCGRSPNRIFYMALHLLALAAVFGHWAVGRAEVFGKRHRCNEAPHRSTVHRIINLRLRRCRLRV